MVANHSPLKALTRRLHLGASGPSATITCATVTGEVDLATAYELRERLLRVLHDGPAILHVDLTGVTFLDCAGIGALVAVRNAAIRAGCRIRFSRAQPIVRLVLEVTGLIDSASSCPIGCSPGRHAGVRAGYRHRAAKGRATS